MSRDSVKERPIIFSAPMVRSILDGSKTQTRRVVKSLRKAPWHKHEPVYLAHRWTVAPHPRGGFWAIDVPDANESWMSKPPGNDAGFPCPYGQPGERLWVRETFCPVNDTEHGGDHWIDYRATPEYSAEHPGGWDAAPEDSEALKWRPSRFMPRRFSRITLELTGVRVERLQEITWQDCKAEGMGYLDDLNREEWTSVAPPGETNWGMLHDWYRQTWDSLNAKRGYSWESNPWVWVLSFRRVEA